MSFLILFLCALCAYLACYILRWCRNKYYLHMIVGSKGSGKSLYMARAANKWFKARRGEVYSNMGIGNELPLEYWKVNYPPDTLILIDEVGVIHGNRDFKSFPPQLIEWYKMQRKRRLTVVVSSQTMDVDKKIRDLCDCIFVCQKIGWVCMMKPFRSRIAMVQRNEDGGRDLVNDIAPAGLPRFYTIPRTADLTQTLGYKTEQIISKQRIDEADSAAYAKEQADANAARKRKHVPAPSTGDEADFAEAFMPRSLK